MPTKTTLYKQALVVKKRECPPISTMSKAELQAYILKQKDDVVPSPIKNIKIKINNKSKSKKAKGIKIKVKEKKAVAFVEEEKDEVVVDINQLIKIKNIYIFRNKKYIVNDPRDQQEFEKIVRGIVKQENEIKGHDAGDFKLSADKLKFIKNFVKNSFKRLDILTRAKSKGDFNIKGNKSLADLLNTR